MVKKISKFLGYTLFFIFALLAFSPKTSLYFAMENELKKFDTIISDEKLNEKLFGLTITNLSITAKGVDTARIEEADINIFLFFNTLTLHNIELSSLADAFLPAKIQSVTFSYTLFNPLVIKAHGVGKFGDANLDVNVLSRELHLRLKASKKMLRSYQNSLRMFKKQENGEYTYVKTF